MEMIASSAPTFETFMLTHSLGRVAQLLTKISMALDMSFPNIPKTEMSVALKDQESSPSV